MGRRSARQAHDRCDRRRARTSDAQSGRGCAERRRCGQGHGEPLIGGGFGRRLEADGAVRAVQIAQHVDGPVKVVWTREEDIQHDMYRPYWFDRLSAGLDERGMPVAWNHRFAGSSVIARWLPPAFNNGLDPDTTEGAIDLAYVIPNMHVEYVRVEPPGIPTAFWRSVGPSHN